jgi:hypothetical protein
MFYTIPIVLSVFTDALTIIVVLFASTMLILRGSVGTYFCQKLGADIKMDLKKTLYSLFTFPPFLAILIGAFILLVKIPIPLEIFLIIKTPVNTIASASGAILIGMIMGGINKVEIKNYWTDIKWVLLWRFGIALIYTFTVIYLIQFPTYQTEIRTIILIILLGPPAVFNVVFSVYFKLEPKFAAIAVATVTLIALAFLPVFLIVGMIIF